MGTPSPSWYRPSGTLGNPPKPNTTSGPRVKTGVTIQRTLETRNQIGSHVTPFNKDRGVHHTFLLCPQILDYFLEFFDLNLVNILSAGLPIV